jgi:hypothetical protein
MTMVLPAGARALTAFAAPVSHMLPPLALAPPSRHLLALELGLGRQTPTLNPAPGHRPARPRDCSSRACRPVVRCSAHNSTVEISRLFTRFSCAASSPPHGISPRPGTTSG